MRITDLRDYTKTKSGQEISFSVQQHTDFAGSPTYVLYEITATVQGEEAGYIKISYVPYENYRKYMGTIFHFARTQGESKLHGLSSVDRLNELTDEDINKIVEAYGENIRPSPREKELNELPIEEKRDLAKDEIYKYFKKWYQDKYKRWINFHVDKPLVDYIRVYDNWKRQGIGLALYLYGARWAQERGLHLWASDLQEPEAASAWAKLADMGLAAVDDSRYYLSI